MLRIFNHYIPANALTQLVLDGTLVFLGILGAASFRHHASLGVLGQVAPSALLFALVMVSFNGILGLYSGQPVRDLPHMLSRILLSLLVSIPIAYGVFRLLPWGGIEQRGGELPVIALLGGVLVLRGFASGIVGEPMWRKRALVIGTGHEALTIEKSIRSLRFAAIDVVGFYQAANNDEVLVGLSRILPASTPLLEVVRQHGIRQIIIAVRERRGGSLSLKQLLDCKLAGVKILDLSSFYERVRGQIRLDSLKASWLIYGEGFRQGWLRSLIKRSFDLAAVLLLFALLWPVMLVAAIAIGIETGFPILYSQERVGQGGRIFRVFKFRSMRLDAEKDGPRWAAKRDERVTRVGGLIRKTRIDELPQLFNVLRGDMSLVGPRPERPFFVDQLAREIPYFAVRHSVKPGLTGWAQVRYQYGASKDDAIQKLQYDLYYVKNHTLFLDTLILAETVRVVLTGEGAH